MFSAALRSVAQKTSEIGEKVFQSVEQVKDVATIGNFKFNRDYRMLHQTGTCGSNGIWRIHAGAARSSNAIYKDVSIWVLDKRQLVEAGRGDAAAQVGPQQAQQQWEAVLEQQRHGCAVMMRLKHPGVVRVVYPLEETATQMVLVTEAVTGCLREALLGLTASSSHTSSTQHQHQHQHQHHSQRNQQHQHGYHGLAQGGSPHAAAAASSAAGFGAGSRGAGHGDGRGTGATEAGGGGGTAVGPLEAKLGVLALAEVLTFLHGTARMAHCGLSPQTVVVAADGGWKLSGFAFAVPLDGPGGTGAGGPGRAAAGGAQRGAAAAVVWPPYSYGDPFPPLWEELSKPALPYTAPELVVPPGGVRPSWAPTGADGGGGGGASPASDAFSLGAVLYEVVAGGDAQLLPVRCSLQQYGSRVAALAGGGVDVSRVPQDLQGTLLGLVSPQPSLRPAPACLASCPWVEGDQLLRALRFLEGMMQSEPRHKLAFVSDLAALWPRMPDSLLLHRVLPPLMQEVRSGGPVGVAALPVALAVAGRLGRAAFAAAALPVLQPVMEQAAAATGGGGGGGGAGLDMLSALVSHSEALAGLMDGPTLDRVLLPMLLRAVGGGAVASAPAAAPAGAGEAGVSAPHAAPLPVSDPRLAQAALGALSKLVAAGLLDIKSNEVRSGLLPVLYGTAGRTTSAAVRHACLGLMAALANRVDRTEGEAMLATCGQLLSVDSSGGTLAAVAALVEALSRSPAWGPVPTAQRLLPLLLPCLVAQGLTTGQLAAVTGAVQAMLTRVVQHAEAQAQLRQGGAATTAASGAAGGLGSGMGGWAASVGGGSSANLQAAGAGAGGSTGRMSGSGSTASQHPPASGLVACTTWGPSPPAAASSSASSTPSWAATSAAAPSTPSTFDPSNPFLLNSTATAATNGGGGGGGGSSVSAVSQSGSSTSGPTWAPAGPSGYGGTNSSGTSTAGVGAGAGAPAAPMRPTSSASAAAPSWLQREQRQQQQQQAKGLPPPEGATVAQQRQQQHQGAWGGDAGAGAAGASGSSWGLGSGGTTGVAAAGAGGAAGVGVNGGWGGLHHGAGSAPALGLGLGSEAGSQHGGPGGVGGKGGGGGGGGLFDDLLSAPMGQAVPQQQQQRQQQQQWAGAAGAGGMRPLAPPPAAPPRSSGGPVNLMDL